MPSTRKSALIRGKVILPTTSGGIEPLDPTERTANTLTISVPIVNYDDNQHAANQTVACEPMGRRLKS